MDITTSWISIVFKSCPSISLKLLKLSSISPMDMWDLAGGERHAQHSVPGSPAGTEPQQMAPTQCRLSLFSCSTVISSLIFQEATGHTVTYLPQLLSIQCLFIKETLPKISSKGNLNPTFSCQYFVLFLCCIILLLWPGSSLLLLMWWPNDLSIHSLRHSL